MIEYEIFQSWAENHFTPVICTDKEIKINSIFVEDYKQHLYCNPAKNVYHCWKSNQSGNLFYLVSQVEKVTYGEAIEILGGTQHSLRLLELRIKEFFSNKKPIELVFPPSLTLPAKTYLIDNLVKDSYSYVRCTNYLKKRELLSYKLYYWVTEDRIIIPYVNEKNEVIYWNGRALEAGERYKGPATNKGEVIFATDWHSAKIYLCEGEFDALSLFSCGLAGWACGGKEVSERQIEYLRPYKICLAFDNDKYGLLALNKIGEKLKLNGIHELSYVVPPKGIKDWNKFLVDYGSNVLSAYIKKCEKVYDLLLVKTLL